MDLTHDSSIIPNFLEKPCEQKRPEPGVWTAAAATTMNISSLAEEQRKARDFRAVLPRTSAGFDGAVAQLR